MSFSELGVCKQKRTTVVTSKVAFSDCDCPSSSSFLISDDHGSDINNHKPSLVVKCYDPKEHYLHEAQDCFLYDSHLNEELQTIQRHIDQNVAECRRHEGQLSRDTSYIRNTDLCSITNKPSKGVLLEVDNDVFENSLIPQVIIAPGGKLDTCNNEFINILSFASFECTTVFDLVEPSQLPKLYQILLIALHHETVPTIQKDGYLSVTLPCADALSCQKTIYMTVSLMNDPDPCNRCFYCILLPQPLTCLGQIISITQDILLDKIT